MKRIVNAFLGKLKWGKRGYAVFALCVATAVALPAQTFTTLLSFDSTDGFEPAAALVQVSNGDLYGTTATGGAYGSGTVFRINPSGALTTLHNFSSRTNGGLPEAALVQAASGDLYGTTSLGGPDNGLGTVFKITLRGALTTLDSFGPTDGYGPYAGLVQATNGDFYGTTSISGANGGGAVFKITPSGALTTLYSFCAQSGCTDGEGPEGTLIQATNGYLYGTTGGGGANGAGTVFKMTPSGTLTTLHSFDGTDGADPLAGLVQATSGDFYGTTNYGGANGDGTVFKITPSGTLTTLYSFCSQSGCTDGWGPVGGLIQATNGDLYGTTEYGGANNNPNCSAVSGTTGCGTVFKITPSGTLTTIYSFCSQSGCTDGYAAYAGLVQATNGDFYGTTEFGGTSSTCTDAYLFGCGTVFSLSEGLGPFVKTQTTSGKVGAHVKILGTDLTGATSVSFNGTAAVFTVVSPSLITTTVPAGATTGKVEVATPGGGLLSSNVPYRVLP